MLKAGAVMESACSWNLRKSLRGACKILSKCMELGGRRVSIQVVSYRSTVGMGCSGMH